MDNYLEPVFSDYEQSFRAFKALLTTDYEIEAYPPVVASKKTFGKEFPGGLIRKPNYKECIFVESSFESADGALSKFHDCTFDGCFFDNCDLRYCDILHSAFHAQVGSSTISSCNFSFGNFINTIFNHTDFSGCSFRQMQFEQTQFLHCTMQYCSIEQSIIKGCIFENLDLRKTGVRYCTFENTKFRNVMFHILDLVRNYGLIQQLRESDYPVSVAFRNEETMPLEDALDYLKKLAPYYLETQQYYELINLYAATNEHEKILDVLPHAFERIIANCDFSALQDLCALIVNLKICTDQQLRDFYKFISQLIIPNKFPHYLRKSYNTYIENIKHILVDNPYNNPEASIHLKTNIESLDDPDMAHLLMSIEANIKEMAPDVSSTILLTHHSPYDILISLCGQLPQILAVCQIFYYCLGGAKSFSDLRGSRKEQTTKKKKGKQTAIEKADPEFVKRIELSIGKVVTFKYEKEYTKRVESLEYVVK